MYGNHWQTGGVEFYLFSWSLMLFPRGCLPLGQQHLPLNWKPDLGFRFVVSPCGRRWHKTRAGSGYEIGDLQQVVATLRLLFFPSSSSSSSSSSLNRRTSNLKAAISNHDE